MLSGTPYSSVDQAKPSMKVIISGFIMIVGMSNYSHVKSVWVLYTFYSLTVEIANVLLNIQMDLLIGETFRCYHPVGITTFLYVIFQFCF